MEKLQTHKVNLTSNFYTKIVSTDTNIYNSISGLDNIETGKQNHGHSFKQNSFMPKT